MNRDRCTSAAVLISYVLLIVTLFFAESSSSAESRTPIAISDAKSSFRDTFASSRHKRAPGWGKRAPGWGKRNFMNEELLGESESDLEERKSIAALKAATYFPEEAPFSSEKRAPGWGKRASVFLKRAPGWGKRSYEAELDNERTEKENSFSDLENNNEMFAEILLEHPEAVKELLKRVSLLSRAHLLPEDIVYADRRAPGWGKRNHQMEINYEDSEIDKRAPGWGKRNHQMEINYEDSETDKRAPGWGKRAPGWGKRNYETDVDDENVVAEKRAPGWGKRAPGWGKRNYEIENDDESFDLDKRAPGWGKRALGRSKKAPGWGKRSVPDNCQELQSMNDDNIVKVVEKVSERCGNVREANKPVRM